MDCRRNKNISKVRVKRNGLNSQTSDAIFDCAIISNDKFYVLSMISSLISLLYVPSPDYFEKSWPRLDLEEYKVKLCWSEQ